MGHHNCSFGQSRAMPHSQDTYHRDMVLSRQIPTGMSRKYSIHLSHMWLSNCNPHCSLTHYSRHMKCTQHSMSKGLDNNTPSLQMLHNMP